MLHHCSNSACRALGTQREALIIAVRKGVHFFFNNIGDFANGPRKKIRSFNQRCSNFRIAVRANHIARSLLKHLPQRSFIGKNINHSPNSAVLTH